MSDIYQTIPEIWAREAAKTLSDSLIFANMLAHELDPNDVWSPNGETYADAVCWAKLLGVTLLVDGRDSPDRKFHLVLPGATRITFPMCSPLELAEKIRGFARTAATPVHPESGDVRD